MIPLASQLLLWLVMPALAFLTAKAVLGVDRAHTRLNEQRRARQIDWCAAMPPAQYLKREVPAAPRAKTSHPHTFTQGASNV